MAVETAAAAEAVMEVAVMAAGRSRCVHSICTHRRSGSTAGYHQAPPGIHAHTAPGTVRTTRQPEQSTSSMCEAGGSTSTKSWGHTPR